jgi:hydroxymethylglutaryl-CoA reductase
LELANAQDPMLVQLGGGARDLTVRLVPTPTGSYVVAHLLVDVRDAMGANAVNSMAEAVAARVGEIAGGRVLLRILTNKADLRLARARAVFDAEALGGAGVVRDMVHAYQLAAADPYRAATHNKGLMNGITAVVLATGNDTRAVEAAPHSTCAGRGRKVHVDVVVRARPEW